MLVDLSERNKLRRETHYEHGLGIIKTNSTTASTILSHQEIEQRMKTTLRLRQISKSAPVRRDKTIYNKWYILPKLRYKDKPDNPKQNPNILNDDEYLYKNLRNAEFWNWKHPFEKKKPQMKNPQYMDKIDAKLLEGFKKYVEDSPTKRLPSIINHILDNKK